MARGEIEVWVRDRVMVARGEPVSGATLVIDAVFRGPAVDATGCLIDVCLAERLLQDVCARFHNDNLATAAEFAGRDATSEVVASVVWSLLQDAMEGEAGAAGVTQHAVRVRESDEAWAARDSWGGAYVTAVRGRCLVAHAFKGAMFGPAQRVHGVTFVVDAVLEGSSLDAQGRVADPAAARALLRGVLGRYNNTNLDDHPEFQGLNTTMETFAAEVWRQMAAGLPKGLGVLRVNVKESDVAQLQLRRRLDGSQPELSVYVRDRIMLAHSFKGEMFGPAQRLHGVTFVVDAIFRGPVADAHGCLIDVCLAEQLLQEACAHYSGRNLDEDPEFADVNSTMENVSAALWARLSAGLRGHPGADGVTGLDIELRESDVARARLSRPLPLPVPRGDAPVLVLSLHQLRQEADEQVCALLRRHESLACVVADRLSLPLVATALRECERWAAVRWRLVTADLTEVARLFPGRRQVLPPAGGLLAAVRAAMDLPVDVDLAQLMPAQLPESAAWGTHGLRVGGPPHLVELVRRLLPDTAVVVSMEDGDDDDDDDVDVALTTPDAPQWWRSARWALVVDVGGAEGEPKTVPFAAAYWAERLPLEEALDAQGATPIRARLLLRGAEEASLELEGARVLTFLAPRSVRLSDVPMGRATLQPQRLLLRCLASQISSGTELKVWRGAFVEGEELDVSIPGMAHEAMRYPLAYGYSFVGVVEAVGAGVDAALVGTTRFAFAAHGSHAVVHVDATQAVPGGVDARDASFLPAVETALALVHDAAPGVGDRVAVVGQGLIGLLVTSILSASCGLDTLDTADLNDGRLVLSRAAGASHAAAALPHNDYDVVIEVTGAAAALQSAVDAVRYAGKLVIGSWYGDATASLSLGLRFHRSHMTIVASQVSNIPGALADRWSKDRRFAHAWRLLAKIRPSALLAPREIGLVAAEIEAAYTALESGEAGVVLIVPTGSRSQ